MKRYDTEWFKISLFYTRQKVLILKMHHFFAWMMSNKIFLLKKYNDIMSLKHHLEPLYSSNLNNFCTEQRKSTWFDTIWTEKIKIWETRLFKSACTTLIEMEQYKQLVHYALAFCSHPKNIASTCKFSFISLESHKPLEIFLEIVV